MSQISQTDEDTPAAQPAKGDLTSGPIMRTLIRFSIPTLGANLLQTMGLMVNTVWVGQLIGEGAVAATAIANMVIFLAFAAVFGFGMATTVKIGQYFGMRDIDGARRAFGTGIGFANGFAILGALAGWYFANDVLRLLSTPASVHALAYDYLVISFLTMPFLTMSLVLSMGLRGAGDASTPLYAMMLTTAIGIGLNPVLILGLGPFPALGIAGSALALAIGNLSGVLLMIAWIYWRDMPLRLRGRELSYLLTRRDELSYVVVKGIPMGAQMLIASSAAVIMIGLVNREGLLMAAAFGAIIQLWNVIQMPAFAISTAGGAMAAQNVGAGLHRRVSEITNAGILATTLITGAVYLLLIAADAPILALFLKEDSGAIPLAEHIQIITTPAWILTGLMMVISATQRAYGVVVVPLIIIFISLYIARLGFYFAGYPTLEAEALWWSYPFSSAVGLVLIWLSYAYGSWRDKMGVNDAMAERS